MTSKRTKKKTGAKAQTFKSIVIEFFKAHGIKSPVVYLAHRVGISRTMVYYILEGAENGIGSNKGQLDPRDASFIIVQADEVLTESERFEPTSIETYLRPLLEKFYNRKETKKK